MGEFKLVSEIIALSESNNWERAKKEWTLKEVFFSEDPETCLCGHFPIIELCIIQNEYNRSEATVGNCCVKKFLDLPSDKIFAAVKRVRSDIEKSLNLETIDHAFANKWVNQWEYDFYVDTFRKRSLSDKQNEKRKQINQKVLQKMNRK